MDNDNLGYSGRDTSDEVLHFTPNSPFYLKYSDNRNYEILSNVTLTILDSKPDNEKELSSVIDRFYLEEKLKFTDLSSLSLADLEYLGIKDADNILKNTKNLCNQNPTYESLVESPNSQLYNEKILKGCAKHLKSMQELLRITEEKFVIVPEDYVLGDKSYASRFVLEALDELSQAAEQMDSKLQQLEELCGLQPVLAEKQASSQNWRAKVGKIVLLTGLIGALGLIGSKLRL